MQKKISYHHNRHRSEGTLIESQSKKKEPDSCLNNSNYYEQNNKIEDNNFDYSGKNINKKEDLEEPIENKEYNKYNNINNETEENLNEKLSPNSDLIKDENYLNLEYSDSSKKMIELMTVLNNQLEEPFVLEKINKENDENAYKLIKEENLKLLNENKILEKKIEELQKLVYYRGEDNVNPEIKKLNVYNNQLSKENENLKILINKIENYNNPENNISFNSKYRMEFFVQNMVSTMKEVLYLLENSKENKNIYTMDTENNRNYFSNDGNIIFTKTSFSDDKISSEQYNLLNMNTTPSKNINNNLLINDNSRNNKERDSNSKLINKILNNNKD